VPGFWNTLFGHKLLSRPEAVGDDLASGAEWQNAVSSTLALPLFFGLSESEKNTLCELAERLLTDKALTPVSGAELDASLRAAIALQAVLPILNLGYPAYQGWREIILYPGEFVPDREITDDFGIVHRVRQPLSGEAWEGGPLVLSLDDVAASGHCQGYNVVIHEFAHKLDMRNGTVNGLPALHAGMSVEAWSGIFNAAYTDFCRRVDADEETQIDPYASESPAEFFAVLSEYFFEAPDILFADYPAVYEQMRQYYRQDPLTRLAPFLQEVETS
jgi:Mlc titration factor MtfA (ptsG expression regulator)